MVSAEPGDPLLEHVEAPDDVGAPGVEGDHGDVPGIESIGELDPLPGARRRLERRREGDRLPGPDEVDLDPRPDGMAADRDGQFALRRRLRSAQADDHVARPEARRLGGRIGGDAPDQDASTSEDRMTRPDRDPEGTARIPRVLRVSAARRERADRRTDDEPLPGSDHRTS